MGSVKRVGRLHPSRGRITSALFVATAGLALWICGCRQRVSPHPRNPLLVTIDTVRADHLRAYGYSAAETLAGEKHFREAAQACKEAIRISLSAAGPIALALARVSLALGERKEAELNAGLAMRESPAEAHEMLARVALARNDLDAAELENALTDTIGQEEVRALMARTRDQSRSWAG